MASAVLEEATEHQGRARVALTAALRGGPSHAYLFRGPRGSGKRAAARAFAAEILAAGADDPDDARRRALLDPSPHPDLVWLAPRGAQHMVDEVRERVIRAAAYRPFEGEHRVFVVEAAEAMRDESQNALLKTLEEPPAFVHLILLSSEPEALLETIASRCQPVDFAPLPAEVLEAQLAATPEAAGATPEEIAAAARLAAGDLERARLLLSPRGRELRDEVERCLAAALADELSRRSLAAPPRARRSGRRGGRSGDPGSARGGVQGGHQTDRQRHHRRRQTRRPAPPHRDPRPRPRALRASGCATWRRSPAAPRRSSSTATASTCCAPRRRRPRPRRPRAAAPTPSRTPAAASTSTSPRSSPSRRSSSASSESLAETASRRDRARR